MRFSRNATANYVHRTGKSENILFHSQFLERPVVFASCILTNKCLTEKTFKRENVLFSFALIKAAVF